MKHINQNLKKLAFIGIVVFSLIFSACDSNTNPLTDKSKHIYHPQNRDELVQLLKDENIKLETIDTSKITDMSYLFTGISYGVCDELKEEFIYHCKNAARYRQDFSGIETWDVSKVTNMSCMFDEVGWSFNHNLNSWDVSNVKDMSAMFAHAKYFNQPLDKWDVSNVEDMEFMFAGAEEFNQSLNSWNVSKATNMYGMFSEAKSFNQNLDSWKVNKDASIFDMFKNSPLESNPPKWYKE